MNEDEEKKETKEENPEIAKISENLKDLKELTQDELDLLTQFNVKLSAEKSKDPAKPIRRIPLGDEDKREIKTIGEIMNLPSRMLSEVEKEIQQKADDAYILSTILQTDPRNLKAWSGFVNSSSALRKAMDTATAGEGQEWVPTMLSADYIEKFRLQAKVAPLFNDVTMPGNPYPIPLVSGGITFYLTPESTSDSPSQVTPSTMGTGKRTLTAKKLKAVVRFSDELSEDSIVPILPVLRSEIALAGADTIDDIIINGDTTSPHMDADVTDSKDRRKSWNGLRDFSATASTTADLSTFDKDTIRGRLTAMGKYGIAKNSCAFIGGVVDYNKLIGLAEVLTVDKYGPQATILNGELAKIYGTPIIISEYIRENLNNSGVYDGSTVDKTILIAVFRPGFMLGTRGGVKLTFKEDDDVDQNRLIMSFRKAFIDRYAVSSSVTTVALGYKIS